MVYKSKNGMDGPQRYCPRCDRAYGLDFNEQIPNWAYKSSHDGTWERKTNGKVSQ